MPRRILAERVFAGGRSKPFAELTADEVKARADELREVTGWGPTVKVGSVARAWARAGTAHGRDAARGPSRTSTPRPWSERAERLWVVPPGGSLL